MREVTEVRSLLARLDAETADCLEGQDLDFKEWPADHRHAVRLAVDAAVCMANGGGGTVVLGVRDRVVGEFKPLLACQTQLTPTSSNATSTSARRRS